MGTNPKTDLRYRHSSDSDLSGLSDPIRNEVVDIEAVKLAYSTFPLIPFFDDSDATLQFFRKMRNLSPTAEACTNRIIEYSTGGGLTTRPARTPGWTKPVGGEEVDISDEQDQAMRDFANGMNPYDDADKLVSEIEQMIDNRLTTGNMWLCLRLVTVGAEKHAYVDAKDSEDIRYWATNDGDPRIAVVSKSFDLHYLYKYPPEVIGVYPNWTTDPDTGDSVTIFHHKDRAIGRKWYGTPRNLATLYPKIMESAQSEYSVRGYKKSWTAKLIVETSGDDHDTSDPVDFRKALAKVCTNEGEGDSFVHRHRLPDDKPIVVHQLESNTDHQFHSVMKGITKTDIIMGYDWHSVLLSEQTPGKLGQSDEFISIYRNKYETVIKPMQEKVLTVMNKALSIAAEFIGNTEVAELSLGLRDMLEDFTDDNQDAEEVSSPNAEAMPSNMDNPTLTTETSS